MTILGRKEGEIVNKVIYVHLDAISNSVLTKGISVKDFQDSLLSLERPDNLLLLSPATDDGEFENHTGLRIIRGNKIDDFFADNLRHHDKKIEWIDFNDVHLVKQLTPIEISELLYFGHMKNHLHSPFFYKLQNNYVFLKINEEVNKIYYRKIDDFYHLLATTLQKELGEHINRKRTFFRKVVDLPILEPVLLKELRSILQEGVVFHFGAMRQMDDEYHIPIYMVEDRLRNVDEIQYPDNLCLATLCCSLSKGWHVHIHNTVID